MIDVALVVCDKLTFANINHFYTKKSLFTRKHPLIRDGRLEKIHRSGTEADLLGIYNFAGAVHATDGSNEKGVMGAANWAGRKFLQ